MHHKLEELLDEYLKATGLGAEPSSPCFQAVWATKGGFYAPAARAHRRCGHAQATAQTSGVAGSLIASLVPGNQDHEFLGK